MENEIWKECGESVNCLYEVSNMGRVKSITKVNKKETILKHHCDKKGYLRIVIIKKTIRIHTLVAYAFLGERPEGMQIDHKDRNKANNHLSNLKYCTSSENMRNTNRFRTDILEQDSKIRDKIIRQQRNNERHITKINCLCGSITNKSDKARHEKSEKHKKYLNSLL
jgi:hypothetical protein